MGVAAISYGVGALSVLGLSFLAWRTDSARYGDAFGCAMMLLITWMISNTLTALYSPPQSWLFYPVMDAICGGLVMWMYATAPHGLNQVWKLALAGLFLVQCISHVAFWMHHDKSPALLYNYAVALNVLFAFQLAVTAWPGGTHVVGRVGDLFHGPVRFGVVRPAGNGPP